MTPQHKHTEKHSCSNLVQFRCFHLCVMR